jgi:hypothetical protein
MALQHLRASTADKRPTPAAMADGQLAMNTNLASPGLFFKDSNGDLVKTGPVHVGTTAPNATPASGGQAGNSKGELWLDTTGSDYTLKTWDGSAWREIVVTSTMIKDGTIVNADVNASAAIAGTKISPDFGSQNLVTTGTATAASLNPTGSSVPTNGVYLPAANSVAISTNGTGRLTVGTTAVSSTLAVDHPLGAVGTPSITFTGDLNTGFWSPTADTLAASTNGAERLRITSTGAVGIGTTSPGSYATGFNDLVVGNHTGNHGITIASQNTSTGRIMFADGTGASEVDVGEILYNHANNSLSISTNRSTAATIDSSGRLLVGTSTARTTFYGSAITPGFQLEAATQASSSLSITNSANNTTGGILVFGKQRSGAVGGNTIVNSGDELGQISFQGADGTDNTIGAGIQAFVDGTPGADDMPGRLVFSTTADGASSPTERMRITNAGNVLVGTTVPIATANDSNDGVVLETRALVASRADSGCGFFRRRSSNGTLFQFHRDTAIVGTISVTTTATAYNTSSDYRLKENVVPLTGAIDRVNQLQVHRFNFIADPEITVDGFLAHEAQEVVPECATGEKDAVNDEGNPVYQGIDQSKLVPLLTAALQEAIGRIETLEAKVAALEAS